MPRYTPGRLSVMGWDLEYVDGLALVSCIEVLVLKGWNNFIPATAEPVILDCGANIGISVLNYKRQYPKAKIIAFEPDPQIAPVLRRNLEVNSARDVRVIEAAVWTGAGEADLFCEGADGSKLISRHECKSNSVTVATVNLADFISEGTDLIKMDIEGAEFHVVPALGERLRAVRNMIIECHVNNDEVAPFGQLLQGLASAGFNVSINSFGAWRDLVRQPEKLPNTFDQYFLVVAWHDHQEPAAS